ncbi:MAG: hypothetical protein ABFD89_06675 [Bryobacteraceae bacterium]
MKFAACALSLMLLAGCTTAPRIVEANGPSLDGGVANSGVLQVLSKRCYLVTPLFNERYTALVKLYGAKLVPPMTAPRWITPTETNTFIITSDGMAAFAEMAFYHRQHLTP